MNKRFVETILAISPRLTFFIFSGRKEEFPEAVSGFDIRRLVTSVRRWDSSSSYNQHSFPYQKRK